jgi:hypothetical protein
VLVNLPLLLANEDEGKRRPKATARIIAARNEQRPRLACAGACDSMGE